MSEGTYYREDIYSKSVRAGKRTYFFDVKVTRGKDLFMTITESKRQVEGEGQFSFEKHKIYLYKEDFEKFLEGMTDTMEKIKELQNSGEYRSAESERKPYHDGTEEVSFERLGDE
jgi:hypothetical protein